MAFLEGEGRVFTVFLVILHLKKNQYYKLKVVLSKNPNSFLDELSSCTFFKLPLKDGIFHLFK